MKFAQFNSFEIAMPAKAVAACSHFGSCDSDVAHWSKRVKRPENCTPDAIRAELKEYGCWDSAELSSDSDNWERIVWLAACNIQENERELAGERGRITRFA